MPERRLDLSPQFRNFDDDERVVTPVSDDENHHILNTDQNRPVDIETANSFMVDTDSNIIDSDVNSLDIDQENNLSLDAMNINNNVTTRIESKYMTPETKKPFVIKSELIGKSITPDTNPVTPDSTIIKSFIIQPQSFVLESQSITLETKSITIESNSVISETKSVTLETKPVTSETKPVTPETKSITSESKSINLEPDRTEEINDEYLEFFDRILCPRNILLLSSSGGVQSDVWEAMATVLVFLLKNDYLSEDSLTEQCLAVYRQDWPQVSLVVFLFLNVSISIIMSQI